MTGAELAPLQPDALPAALADMITARRAIEDLLFAEIRNPHTRRAYIVAARDFFRSLSGTPGLVDLAAITPLHVARWIEAMQATGLAAPTVKQRLAAVRRIFQVLAARCIIPADPTAVVRGPAYSARRGKTPVLDAGEARALLDGIDATTPIGLRDRALIGVMVYTFARIGAVTQMRREDVFTQQRRLWIRLHEKRGKRHEMPCHHMLEGYLVDYIDAAGIADPKAWLFQTFRRERPEPDVTHEETLTASPPKRTWTALTGNPMSQPIAWAMVQRRARTVDLATAICNHTFRATGITTYLSNGGTIERAAAMAGHTSTRTTQLYDRRPDDITLDEIERIRI